MKLNRMNFARIQRKCRWNAGGVETKSRDGDMNENGAHKLRSGTLETFTTDGPATS